MQLLEITRRDDDVISANLKRTIMIEDWPQVIDGIIEAVAITYDQDSNEFRRRVIEHIRKESLNG